MGVERFLEARQILGDRLNDDAAGLLRLVHVRSEVSQVTGQQVGGVGGPGGEKDRPIFLREVDWRFSRRGLWTLSQLFDQPVEAFLALRVLRGNVPSRLFDCKAAGNEFPTLRGQLVEEKRRFAVGIVCCREQDVGVQEQLIHGDPSVWKRVSAARPF